MTRQIRLVYPGLANWLLPLSQHLKVVMWISFYIIDAVILITKEHEKVVLDILKI